jgi:hypothetical protein
MAYDSESLMAISELAAVEVSLKGWGESTPEWT